MIKTWGRWTLMREIKKLFYCLSLLLVILAFQNCGMQSQLDQARKLSSFEESGNGGGYEGKPDGTYYLYVPSYTCEGTPSAEQVTEIKDGQAFLYSNQSNQCANQSTPIPITDINISPFQKEFISVKDTLFKRYDEKPVGIPNNLAEILCRDNFENPSFEIVSHYDREKNEALARVYQFQKQVPDFSISRVLSPREVKYVSNELSFTVDISKPSQADKKFAGVVEKSLIAGVYLGPVVCVVGGSLDTTKWAVKEITQLDAGSLHPLQNGEIVFFSEISRTYFSTNFFRTVNHMFKVTIDGIVSDFTKSELGDEYNVIYVLRAEGKNISMFAAKTANDMWPSTYVYDSENKITKKLTNLVSGGEPEAYNLQTPVLTADRHLFYDTRIVSFYKNNGTVLRVYDFVRDEISDVEIFDSFSSGYVVLPASNKAVLFYTQKDGIKNVIDVYDAKTKTSKRVNLKMNESCQISPYAPIVVEKETAILTSQYCSDSTYQTVLLSLADGEVKIISDGNNVQSWLSPSKKWMIVQSGVAEYSAYGIATGQKIKVPFDPKLGYYSGPGSSVESLTNFILSGHQSKIAFINERYIYGLGGTIDAPHMYQVDVTTGLSAEVCENAVGRKIFIGSLEDKKAFVFTYDAVLKVYRFYQAKGPNDCPRINEFPSDFPYVPKLMPTKIGFGLLLGNSLSASTRVWTREAVFVPIDGRPPLKFNTDSDHNWEMEVFPDQNKIVMRGPGASGVLKILKVDLN